MKTTKTFPKGTPSDVLFSYIDRDVENILSLEINRFYKTKKEITITIEKKENKEKEESK